MTIPPLKLNPFGNVACSKDSIISPWPYSTPMPSTLGRNPTACLPSLPGNPLGVLGISWVVSKATEHCPGHLAGRLLRPSWPSLTRRKLHYTIWAVLSFRRRSIGRGCAACPLNSKKSSLKSCPGGKSNGCHSSSEAGSHAAG